MPYRPQAAYRKNIHGVIIPLTAAIHRVFGNRTQDQGRPIGAFFPLNVSSAAWLHLGGIWYSARDEQKVLNRNVNERLVQNFVVSIMNGEAVTLPSGIQVTWELIPLSEAAQLPPPFTG